MRAAPYSRNMEAANRLAMIELRREPMNAAGWLKQARLAWDTAFRAAQAFEVPTRMRLQTTVHAILVHLEQKEIHEKMTVDRLLGLPSSDVQKHDEAGDMASTLRPCPAVCLCSSPSLAIDPPTGQHYVQCRCCLMRGPMAFTASRAEKWWNDIPRRKNACETGNAVIG